MSFIFFAGEASVQMVTCDILVPDLVWLSLTSGDICSAPFTTGEARQTSIGNLVYAYLPSANSWSTLEDFPGSGRRLAESFTINGYGYLCGGTNGTNFKDLWRMNGYLGEEEVGNSDFVIYPNPATIYFEIRSDANMPVDVHLFNTSGSKVLSRQNVSSVCNLNRGDLPSGTYVLKVLLKGKLVGTKSIVLK